MKRMMIAGAVGGPRAGRIGRRHGPGQEDHCVRRQRPVGLLEDHGSGRRQGADGAAGLRTAVQVSGARRRGRAAPHDGRPRRRRRRRHFGVGRRSADLDRRDQRRRREDSVLHLRLGRDPVQAHRLCRLVQHRARHGGWRADEEGDGRQAGQVHRLRRPARRRQRQGAYQRLQRSRQGYRPRADRRPRRRHRPDPRPRQRRRRARRPSRKSTAWSASTPTTRRACTKP